MAYLKISCPGPPPWRWDKERWIHLSVWGAPESMDPQWDKIPNKTRKENFHSSIRLGKKIHEISVRSLHPYQSNQKKPLPCLASNHEFVTWSKSFYKPCSSSYSCISITHESLRDAIENNVWKLWWRKFTTPPILLKSHPTPCSSYHQSWPLVPLGSSIHSYHYCKATTFFCDE